MAKDASRSGKPGMKFTNPMREAAIDDSDDEDLDPEKEVTIVTGRRLNTAPENAVDADGDKNGGGLGEEEIADLTFAFEACDLDSGGTIDNEELLAVLRVFGADITEEEIAAVIVATQKDFRGQRAVPEQKELMMFSPRNISRKFNKDGKDLLVEVDGELNLPEFIHMMTAESAAKFFPNGWEEGAYHMRLLKNAYNTADADGDNELTFEELSTSINSLVRPPFISLPNVLVSSVAQQPCLIVGSCDSTREPCPRATLKRCGDF